MWEGGSGWGTHVNPWLIHGNVCQNPLQYCKVISLQLIKIIGEKKKDLFLLKFFCTFTTVPKKIPESCFVDTDQLILKFLWRGKGPRTDQRILKKKDKVGRPTSHNFIYLFFIFLYTVYSIQLVYCSGLYLSGLLHSV